MGRPLFVYGTLKTGEDQAALLGALPRRRAWTRGSLWALPAGYPALVPGGDGRVEGELVDPPDERLLGLLDGYEGVDEGLFERVVVPVVVGLRSFEAWAYTLDEARAKAGRRIASGRWRALRRR
jgi:gamma-glutamylcyclotransferase (GGCT)/AIG2-like uncharacterized protein YtfP